MGCAPLVQRIGQSGQGSEAIWQARVQQFLTAIAVSRPNGPTPGIINGERVIADYVGSGDRGCVTVLITYQDLNHAETWNACPDGTVGRAYEEVLKLPAASDFIAVRHAATQAAWRMGKSRVFFADYDIFARTVGFPDGHGCAMIENSVTLAGNVVDVKTERVCESN